jgi:hypothetical protein
MNDTIKCPHCGKKFPLDQAMTHEIKEKLEVETNKKLDDEKKRLNDEARSWREGQLTKLKEKAKEEMELQLKDKSNELEELRNQKKELQEQTLELNKLVREIKQENDKQRIEMEKQLTASQEKIREEEKRKSDEENKLKILEKDKKISDAMKMVEEYKRKLEQGSQQTQGEVMEDELKKIIGVEFPFDELSDVPKGIRGADLVQTVKNNAGKKCGTILWESKRTKVWTEGWISKLKQDQREMKAELAIIVTQVMPQGIKNFGLKDGIWVVDYKTVIGAAISLRNNLMEVFGVRSANKGKEEKKEILWNYLTSIEFKQRVEAIYESYSGLSQELQKEKDWFTHKWAREEKNISLIKENLLGMHGDLEGIVGKTLPELEQLKKIESGE